jgi:RNA polymerase sigma-70 factor (ECF subfamily)
MTMLPSLAAPKYPEKGEATGARPTFEALYAEQFAFAWRMLWRLGVPAPSVADAAQDVFVVVYRRLDQLQGGELARSWVYGIVVRVARDYRRAHVRKGRESPEELEQLVDDSPRGAQQHLEQRESVALLDRLLGTLPDEQREVLVLVELEQLTVPEIAELLGMNVNTVYTRLRAARKSFDQALARHRAQARRKP